MKTEFNHAANDSPRSGSSKQLAPLVWFAVVACIMALGIWSDRSRIPVTTRERLRPILGKYLG